MYSIEELVNDFRKQGIRAADTVMLHASVRAVGEVAGGSRSHTSCPQIGGNFGRHSYDVRKLPHVITTRWDAGT
jgi:hypothetical protein